jgi:hypothetical protein
MGSDREIVRRMGTLKRLAPVLGNRQRKMWNPVLE